MVSVREYAASRGVSPQAIFQRLNRMGLKTVLKGNRAYLPDEVKAALDSSYDNPPPRKPRRDRVGELEKSVANLEQRVVTLEQRILELEQRS